MVRRVKPGDRRVYRRVIPSPKEMVEADIIRKLADLGLIVITCGSGGIPVIKKGGELPRANAAIDKDLTA